MTTPSQRGLFGARFARDLWRLTRVYWTSPDAPFGALLLLSAIVFELATVHASVLIAHAEGQIFDALGDRQMGAFFGAMGVFLTVIGGFVVASNHVSNLDPWPIAIAVWPRQLQSRRLATPFSHQRATAPSQVPSSSTPPHGSAPVMQR